MKSHGLRLLPVPPQCLVTHGRLHLTDTSPYDPRYAPAFQLRVADPKRRRAHPTDSAASRPGARLRHAECVRRLQRTIHPPGGEAP
eukprot:6770679-Pyramimonas_sp.AAC.1